MFIETLALIPHDLGMDLSFCASMVAIWGLVIAGFITCYKSEDGLCA